MNESHRAGMKNAELKEDMNTIQFVLPKNSDQVFRLPRFRSIFQPLNEIEQLMTWLNVCVKGEMERLYRSNFRFSFLLDLLH